MQMFILFVNWNQLETLRFLKYNKTIIELKNGCLNILKNNKLE